MPDTAHIPEDNSSMPEDRQSRSVSDERACAIELAGVAERLDAIKEEVTRLANHFNQERERVAENQKEYIGRISDIEKKCVAHDSMSVYRTQTEMDTEAKIEKIDGRVKNLETYRDEATGMGKASLGILTQILTIAALALAVWQFATSGTGRSREPAPQQQAK